MKKTIYENVLLLLSTRADLVWIYMLTFPKKRLQWMGMLFGTRCIDTQRETNRRRKPFPCCFGTIQLLFLLPSPFQPSSLRFDDDKSPSD